MNYIYGPIPSRRLGKSLGISPISKKTCNLSCVYCQLGLTDKMTNEFVNEFEVDEIIDELKEFLGKNIPIDVITIVGEGEPTLYQDLGQLIDQIKLLTQVPIAIITNGTKLTEKSVYQTCLQADIVLPSLDAYDELSFKKINRPHKEINFKLMIEALVRFSHEYQGKLWLETMICKSYNDSDEAIKGFKKVLTRIKHDKYYINSPVRPPAVKSVMPASHQRLDEIAKELKGINIDVLADPNFYSSMPDDVEAILSIIRRHPMNQFEISSFLESRKCENKIYVFDKLRSNRNIEVIIYKSYDTYRYKVGF